MSSLGSCPASCAWRRHHEPDRSPWDLAIPPLSAVFVLLLLVLALARTSSSATINVPVDQPTVRAAVDAAVNGDTILVAPGIHAGGVFVEGKAVTLASWFVASGDTALIAQTVIGGVVGNPCSGGHPSCVGNAVLEFGSNAHGSAVVGLTVTQGENGVSAASTVDIDHCRIVGNGDGVDYVSGGGGVFRNSLFAGNSDDGIDLNGRISVRIVDNVIRNNRDDGIEYRLFAYSGPVMSIDITGNRITGNGEDGLQLIDYPDVSDRVIRVERNVFSSNFDAAGASAAIGCMANGQTVEDLSGAAIPERVYVIHNTFLGERNGLVGGANVIALNNLFVETQGSAVRRVAGNSILSYALFWNDGIDYEESSVDLAHLLYGDPGLGGDGGLTAGSPAIDAGTAFFQWQGATVLDVLPTSYVGSAPDLGAFEFTSGTAGNTAPVVSAGADQSIVLPAGAVLDGTVSDDGLPNSPGALTTGWSVASGPGPVTFQDANAVDTQASFTTAGTYVLRLTASDGELSASDQVEVTVQEAGPPPVSTIVERRIAAASDDAEEAAGGTVNLSSADIDLVFSLNNQTVGLRFTEVAVPPGASITGAYIQFEAGEAQSEATDLVLQGQAADNPSTFTWPIGNVSTRPRTEAVVSWSPAPWTVVGGAGADQRTPDLGGVIQEIVNRPRWVSGNALAIIITGTGHRTAVSYEGKASRAAVLHVEFTSGGPRTSKPARASRGAGPKPVFALHRVSPNPAHAVLRVEFSLEEGPGATLELLEVTGRRVATREVGSLGPGRHQLELRGLPAGVYLVRLTQGNRMRTTKALVLR